LHHEVFGEFFFVEALEDEGGGADGEDGDVTVQALLEAEGFIKGLADSEVFGGDEGAG
jgi:hypothetical protein